MNYLEKSLRWSAGPDDETIIQVSMSQPSFIEEKKSVVFPFNVSVDGIKCRDVNQVLQTLTLSDVLIPELPTLFAGSHSLNIALISSKTSNLTPKNMFDKLVSMAKSQELVLYVGANTMQYPTTVTSVSMLRASQDPQLPTSSPTETPSSTPTMVR